AADRGVDPEGGVEIGIAADTLPSAKVGTPAQVGGDVGEGDLVPQKPLDRDLVRRREADHRRAIARAGGLEDDAEARVTRALDLTEAQHAGRDEVEAREVVRRARAAEERVLDRQPHVWSRELRLEAAVGELDERVDDALGVPDDVDALVGDAVEPMRLDDLVALVRER